MSAQAPVRPAGDPAKGPGPDRTRAGTAELTATDVERSPLARVVPGMVLVAALAGVTIVVAPAMPVVVVVATLVVIVAWRRPVVAAVLVAAVVPALSGLARGALLPGVKVSEVLLLTCAVVVFLRRPAQWRALSGVDAALIAFGVVGLGLAMLHSALGGGLDVEALLRDGLQPMFLFVTWWTASRAVGSREDVLVVMRWVLGVSAVLAAVGVVQYLDVPGVREGIIAAVGEGLMPVPGEEVARITGPFPIAHSYGGYLLLPTVLAAVLLLRGDRDVLPRWALAVVLTVDLAAVVLSVTVTMLVWVPVALLVAAALARRLRRALVLLAAVAALSLLLFAEPLAERLDAQTTASSGTTDGLLPQTVQYRILVWQRDYLPLMGRAAPIGLGQDQPSSVLFAATENQYLTYWLRGGVGLLLVAVVALTALAVRALRQARAVGGGEQVAAMAVVGVVVFLPAASMVWPYVTNAGLPQALFAFAGAALALDRARRRRAAPPAEPARAA